MGKPMTKKQILNWIICQTYLAGHSPRAIADALNLKEKSVIGKLVREGVYTKEYVAPTFETTNWGF